MNKLTILTVLALGAMLTGCGGDKPADSTTDTTKPGTKMANDGKKTDTGTPAASGTPLIADSSKDADLTKAAQEKLDADPTLKAAGVKAEAKNAQVELTGTVQSVADKDKAEAAAIEAIKPFAAQNAGVVNNLLVNDPQDPEATKK